jgi:hypothetical protein
LHYSNIDVLLSQYPPEIVSFTPPASVPDNIILYNQLSKRFKIMALTQKITSNLWFDSEAEDAAKFYVSVFKNASIAKSPAMARKVLSFMVNSRARL